MVRSTPGVPEDVVFMLREIEDLSAQVDQLSRRVTEILTEAVDGENVIQFPPADSGVCSGWRKRRELGR